MVSAAGSTKTKRILLGRSGSENSFAQLADGLRAEGFKVVEERSSPVGAHSTTKAIAEILQGIDVVLLVVHKNDGIGPTPPFERVMRDAKIIQDSIGEDKIVLLVEETVDGLPDTGISHIRFPTSRADMILQEVVNKVGATTAPPVRDKHAHIPMAEQALSSALRIPWLLVFVVLLSAAIPIAIAINSLRSGDDDPPDPPTETMAGLAANLAQGSAAVGPGGGTSQADDSQNRGADEAQEAEASEAGGSTTDAADPDPAAPAAGPTADPAAPVVALGANNELLPGSCEIDLARPSLLDGAISCDGTGRLVVEGRDDDWHNDVRAVALADGAVGQLRYERGSSDANVIDLTGGTTVLNGADAGYGVSGLTVRFSAQGQHVHLFADANGTGEFVTMTFSVGG